MGERSFAHTKDAVYKMDGDTMKGLIGVLMCGVLLFALSACNTIHGMGQDIEEGGEAIQRAVK